MRYVVSIADYTVAVGVVGTRVTVDGDDVVAQLESVPHTPLRRLSMDGSVTTMALGYDGDRWQVQSGGRTWITEVVDERTRRIRELAGAAGAGVSGGTVSAPMPGLVLRIEVEEGQPVKRGADLLVLEAMKMENEIRASGDGIVTRILVQPGAVVEKGAPLVEIDPGR